MSKDKIKDELSVLKVWVEDDIKKRDVKDLILDLVYENGKNVISDYGFNLTNIRKMNEIVSNNCVYEIEAAICEMEKTLGRHDVLVVVFKSLSGIMTKEEIIENIVIINNIIEDTFAYLRMNIVNYMRKMVLEDGLIVKGIEAKETSIMIETVYVNNIKSNDMVLKDIKGLFKSDFNLEADLEFRCSPIKMLMNYYDNTINSIEFEERVKPQQIALPVNYNVSVKDNGEKEIEDILNKPIPKIEDLLRYEEIVLNRDNVETSIEKAISLAYSDIIEENVDTSIKPESRITAVASSLGLTAKIIKDFLHLANTLSYHHDELEEMFVANRFRSQTFSTLASLVLYNDAELKKKITDSTEIKMMRIFKLTVFSLLSLEKVRSKVQSREVANVFIQGTPQDILDNYPVNGEGFKDVKYEYIAFYENRLWSSVLISDFERVEENMEIKRTDGYFFHAVNITIREKVNNIRFD